MKFKNVIVINDYAYIDGGASQVALSSAMALAGKGHNVVVFSAVAPIVPELVGVNNLTVVCTEQYEILKDPNRLRASIQGVWNLRASQALIELLQNFDPKNTVVHVHLLTKALSSSVVSVALKRRFSVVCTLHDYSVACPAGGFYNHPKQEICHLKPMGIACVRENCDSRSYSHKAWRVGRQLVQKEFGLIPKAIKHFITISELSRSLLQPHLPEDARIYPVSNPIVVEKKTPVSVNENTAYVFIGRLSKEKGPSLFAAGAHRLGVIAVFVGDGECRETVLKINPTAKITGWLPHTEAVNYLKRARVLVFPSLWYETQGLVVAEAAAMGVPAIVPDTCAAREFVVNGVTGLWFEGGNLDDLTHKMSLFENSEIGVKMGLAAYEHYWSSPLSVDHHVKRLEEVYSSILDF